MPRRKEPSKVPMAELTDKQRADLDRIESEAFLNYEGSFDELEKAIGILRLGHHVGWKPLMLIHSKRTISKYEEILGIRFRDTFNPEGPSCERSVAYKFAKKLTNFWKAVSGDTPVPVEDRQQFTRNIVKGS
jgi:hypothetical protein